MFKSQESRCEIGTKATGYIVAFLLFINSFFGYWVSLDKGKFAPQVSDWSSMVAAIIIFYIIVEMLAVTTFLSIVYTWPRMLYLGSLVAVILFIAGLTNVALCANGFCFFLLVVTVLASLVLGYHYQCLIRCQASEHHVTCRGGCRRSEDAHSLDANLGGFLSRNCPGLLTLIGAGVTGGATADGQNANRHVAFTNEPDEEEETKKTESADGKAKTADYEANGFQPTEVIATTASSAMAGSSDTLRTQRHRRQLSGANLFEVQSIEESSHRRIPSNGSAISNTSTSKQPAELRADHLFD